MRTRAERTVNAMKKRNAKKRLLWLCSVLLCVLFITGTAAENGEIEQPSGSSAQLTGEPRVPAAESGKQPSGTQAETPSETAGSHPLKCTLYAKPLNEQTEGYGEAVDASHLSAEQTGRAVVEAAMTKRDCTYLWGGKGDDEFDCSGLVYWAIQKVDPKLGEKLYRNASEQAKYCYDRFLTLDASELRPGDLVFWNNKTCPGCGRWREIHHVAIYIGDGQIIDASSETGCVSVRAMTEDKNSKIVLYGRPYQ